MDKRKNTKTRNSKTNTKKGKSKSLKSKNNYPKSSTYAKSKTNKKSTTNQNKYRQNAYSQNYYKPKEQYNKYSQSTSSRKTTSRKKVKNRNFNILAKVFTFIVFILIISYFSVSIFKSLNKKPIDYETIEYGSIDKTTQVKGVIIRDEVVYKANKNGMLTFSVTENEKVKKGELIATVKDAQATQQTEQDLKAINEKILQIQEQRNELSLFYDDVKKIDSQIQKSLDSAIPDLSTYNIDKIYTIKDAINKKVTIRNQMLLSETNGSVEELSNQKASKEQVINQNTENIIANDSGILSYYTDGLEDTYSIANKDSLTKEQTLAIADKEQQFKTNILQGEPAFKIVKDNNFYIASYIKSEYISKWSKGDTRNIYINDNGDLKPLEVTIESIGEGEKEKYVLMKTNRNMIDFIDKRAITFELTKPKDGFKLKLSGVAEEELLKIPTSYVKDESVIKKDEQGKSVNVPIKISGKDDMGDYVYVSIVKGVIDIGDTIISPVDNTELKLNDIFTLRGIYVVNSGIYTFKSIDTEGSVEDEQFIVIEPNINTNIKLYDRYASDVSVIQQEGSIKDEQTTNN